MFVGPDEDLAWAEKVMDESFLIKVVGRLGGDPGDQQEIRILNRVLRWTDEGILYEADPRHAEILAREVGANGCAVRTPGVKGKVGDGEEELLKQRRSGSALEPPGRITWPWIDPTSPSPPRSCAVACQLLFPLMLLLFVG